MHDLVIRGGTIVDGSGGPPRDGDVTIDGARVASVGGHAGAGQREVDARELLYLPFLNYAGFDFEPIREMLLHPRTVVGLADGGAHCGVICDASTPTFLLTHWVRDRRRGARLPLEHLVRRQTQDTAVLYGLHDRGVLAPGMKADVNVIDLDALALAAPEMVFDLPAQGRRLVQRARGYRATVVSGAVVAEDGQATGTLSGRLIRGPQSSPQG